MPTYMHPGIYIEEVGSDSRLHDRPGMVSTSTTSHPRRPQAQWFNESSTVGFVGLTSKGIVGEATYIANMGQFTALFGKSDLRNPLPLAVHGFFANGGSACYVVPINGYDFVGDSRSRTGVSALEQLHDVSIVCAPDIVWLHREGLIDQAAVRAAQLAMIAHCEYMGDRVVLLDPPASLNAEAVLDWREDASGFDSKYAGLFYPWIKVFADDRTALIPPSGHVAGAWAAVDRSFGPHVSALGRTLIGVLGTERTTLWTERALLHPRGVNVLDHEPGHGITILGDRSLASDPDWRQVHRRRLANLISRNLREGMLWVLSSGSRPLDLLEPVRQHIEGLLTLLWRGGALRGDTPEDAFEVRCTRENNPMESMDAGQVLAEVEVVTLDGKALALRVVHVLA
ncbi:MAG: phage tail sheath subtilisin-like domain-containing protein [Kineosporiaceae bacterium]